jgi:AraC family transcriptional regulator, regulatory protein of adaptative response / DNA-3-methyladenine glycosylase II
MHAAPPACGSTAAHPVAALSLKTGQGRPPSAEAAGRRPCLKCRPYRLPQASPRGTPELICRAVRMIVAGALDQDTEASLAVRLGVSSRHLRRLFMASLGVTPDGLARACRAHVARRLLNDTDMPVTEIAYMAGFGSSRQFNRDCQRIFHATPSQLRARKSPPGRLAADDALTLRLRFTGPLDWDAFAAFFAARAVPGVEHVDGLTYRRTIIMDGDPGVLELGPGGRDHLRLRVHLPHWTGLMHVAARARRIASLDEYTAEPVRSLASDPATGPLLVARPGARVPGCWDPFEIGIVAIIGQWLAAEASHALIARLVRRLGLEVPGLEEFCLSHAFPTPRSLAQAGTDLKATGLASDQADAIMRYASAVEKGAVRLDGSMDLDHLISSITFMPGISAGAAHYIALRMGEPDAHLIDDPVLIHSLRRLVAGLSPESALRWQPWPS